MIGVFTVEIGTISYCDFLRALFYAGLNSIYISKEKYQENAEDLLKIIRLFEIINTL